MTKYPKQEIIKDVGFPDVEYNKNLSYGDLSSPVALKVAKREKKKPMEVAQTIVKDVKLPKSVSAVSVSAPGFINFRLSNDYLAQILKKPWQTPFRNFTPKKERVLIEYSSPNIAKPFGIGHLRSTIIGDAVANCYSALGHKVIRVNHIGDWGTQFGKLLYAFNKWGNEKVVEGDPVNELLRLYVRFHSEAEIDETIVNKARYWFKKLESKDEEATLLWKKFSGWSLQEFRAVYKKLGVKFDLEKGESEYIALASKIITELQKKKITTESEDALIVRFQDETMTPALVMKKDGATLYITRDLAALRYRIKTMKADTVIYHVGSEQGLYFKQLFAIACRAGWVDKNNLVYAPHGLIRLKEGTMSTRKGNYIALNLVLEEAVRRARAIIDEKNPRLSQAQKEKIAHAIGIGAIKYNDLQNNRTTTINFDWDRMLSFSGNSAPYLQYTYARLKSVHRKAKVQPFLRKELNDEERTIAVKIVQFPDIVASSAENQSPNILALYIYELSVVLTNYYEKFPVLKADIATQKHRLAVLLAGAKIIKCGLNILGVEAPEEI